MRTIRLFLVVLCAHILTGNLNAQALSENIAIAGQNIMPNAFVDDGTGNVYLIAHGYNNSTSSVVVAKIGGGGSVIWSKNISPPAGVPTNYIHSVTGIMRNGNLVVFANTNQGGWGMSDTIGLLVYEITANGNIQNEYCYGAPVDAGSYIAAYAGYKYGELRVMPDDYGNLYLTYNYFGIMGLVKFGQNLNLLWNNNYLFNSQYGKNPGFHGFVDNNEIILTGKVEDTCVVIRINGLGQPVWTKALSDGQYRRAIAVVQNDQGNFVMAGRFGLDVVTPVGMILVMNSTGQILTEKHITFAGSPGTFFYFTSIVQDGTGNYYLTASDEAYNNYVVRLDANFNVLASYTINGMSTNLTNESWGTALHKTYNGLIYYARQRSADNTMDVGKFAVGGTIDGCLTGVNLATTVYSNSTVNMADVSSALQIVPLNLSLFSSSGSVPVDGDAVVTVECGALGTGVEEVIVAEDLSIYPNPVSEITTFKCPAELNGAKARIISNDGKLMNEFVMSAGSNNIAVNNLSNGMYQLVITGKDRLRYSSKMMVLH